MSNSIIIEQLKKDLSELQLLVDGFGTLGTLPPFLSKLAIRKASEITEKLEKLSVEVPSKERAASPAASSKTDLVEPMRDEPKVVEPKIVTPKPAAEPVAATPIPRTPVTEPVAQQTAVPAPEAPGSAKTAASDSFTRLREMLNNHPKKTVADSFNANASLNSKLENASIDDLRRVLSINDKFRFQKALFGNSPERLSETLEAINNMKSATEAEFFLKRNVTLAPESDRSVLDELIGLVRRRFAI